MFKKTEAGKGGNILRENINRHKKNKNKINQIFPENKVVNRQENNSEIPRDLSVNVQGKKQIYSLRFKW